MSDMWTPPSARSSQYPSQPTDGFDALLRRGESMLRELRDGLHGLLKAAGISVEPGTLRILGSLAVDNDITIGGSGEVTGLLQSTNFVPGVSGWRLTSTGLEVNTLTAKDAIIGNAALTDPVIFQTGTASAGPTSAIAGADFATVSVTVPAGCTRASVSAVCSMLAGGGPPNLTASANINGNLGFAMVVANLTGTEASGTATHAVPLTGLTPGTSFNVSTRVVTKSAATNLTYFTTTVNVAFQR